VHLETTATLGSRARATAGFRDEYYGITAHVAERADVDDREDVAPLMTSGLIDPGRVLWGGRRTRFGGATWTQPVVRLGELTGRTARWAADVLVPKVVLATQTRVLEAAVDTGGGWWPSVPVIAVRPVAVEDPDELWRLLAVLLAPPVSAWAWWHHAGGALSADAVKLAAREVHDVPLPVDADAWEDGARLACQVAEAAEAAEPDAWRAAIEALGRTMDVAYGVDGDEVFTWWAGRLPAWR
jgi:hypothetical protein